MSEPVATYRPAARVDGLIVTEAGADLVVFDEQTSHLHTLPAPVAAVWQVCDGTVDLSTIAEQTGLTVVQVEAALLQLREAALIELDQAVSAPSSLDRRALLRRAALGAAMVSVTAPLAVQAQSAAPVSCATVPTVEFEGYCIPSGQGTINCVSYGCPAETWYIYYESSYIYDNEGELETDTYRSRCRAEDGNIFATSPWIPLNASNYPPC